MDAELKKLYEQQREINRKIAIMRGTSIISGCAKFSRFGKNCNWYLGIFQEYPDDSYRRRYRNQKGCFKTIITDSDKDVVINKIPQIINDLQGLYKQITEDLENE